MAKKWYIPIVFSVLFIACNISPQTTNESTPAHMPSNEIVVSPNVLQTMEIETVIPLPRNHPENVVPGIIWSNSYLREDIGNALDFNDSFAIYSSFIYLETQEEKIQAFNYNENQLLWTTDGHIIIGADDTNVYTRPAVRRIDAIDVNTGEIRWRTQFKNDITRQMVITDYLSMVVFNYPDGYYAILDKFTGEIINEFPGFILAILDNVIISVDAKSIIGISQENGLIIWEIEKPTTYFGSTSILICNNNLYLLYRQIVNENTILIVKAVNPITGERLWETDGTGYHTLICGYPHYSGLDFAEGTYTNIYTTIGDYPDSEKLVGINPTNGEIRWRGNNLHGDNSPGDFFLGEAGGLIYYTNSDYGYTKAYDTISHRLIWENFDIVLGEVDGVIGELLIGHTYVDETYTFLGLDNNTGNEIWRYEVSNLRNREFIGDHLLIGTNGQVTIINPFTGKTSNLLFGGRYHGFSIHSQLIVVTSSSGEKGDIGFIRP